MISLLKDRKASLTVRMANDQDSKMTDAEQDNGDKKQQPAAKKGKKGGKEEKHELSEEDLELKADLEMLVERIRDSDPGISSTALDHVSR